MVVKKPVTLFSFHSTKEILLMFLAPPPSRRTIFSTKAIHLFTTHMYPCPAILNRHITFTFLSFLFCHLFFRRRRRISGLFGPLHAVPHIIPQQQQQVLQPVAGHVILLEAELGQHSPDFQPRQEVFCLYATTSISTTL